GERRRSSPPSWTYPSAASSTSSATATSGPSAAPASCACTTERPWRRSGTRWVKWTRDGRPSMPPADNPLPAGFTVMDLCRRWKVGPDKIRGFLRRGELVGVNLAGILSGNRQGRITAESVEHFERRRTSVPPTKPRRRKRTGIVDYFP